MDEHTGPAQSSGGAGSAQVVVVSWGLRGRGPGVRKDTGNRYRTRAARGLGRRCAVRGCQRWVRRLGGRTGGDVGDPEGVGPEAVTREGTRRLRLGPRHHVRGLATGTEQLGQPRGARGPKLECSDSDAGQQ